MPPALVDCLPEEHFVWTVLGAVEHMDLGGFYGAYRPNGQGRAAYALQTIQRFASRVCDGGLVLAAD